MILIIFWWHKLSHTQEKHVCSFRFLSLMSYMLINMLILLTISSTLYHCFLQHPQTYFSLHLIIISPTIKYLSPLYKYVYWSNHKKCRDKPRTIFVKISIDTLVFIGLIYKLLIMPFFKSMTKLSCSFFSGCLCCRK